MTWHKLQSDRIVSPESPSPDEIRNLLNAAQRDIADASQRAISSTNRFNIAYKAALSLATVSIRASGYRVSARVGHHSHTFNALELSMGTDVSRLAAYFDVCRQKRNASTYSGEYEPSETEAQEILESTIRFRIDLESWLRTNHPTLIA